MLVIEPAELRVLMSDKVDMAANEKASATMNRERNITRSYLGTVCNSPSLAQKRRAFKLA